MKVEYVVYGAFRDFREYREYYDLIIAHEALIIISLGRMPLVPKKRPSLPRIVERQLLELQKQRLRDMYTDPHKLEDILHRSSTKILYQDIVVGVFVKDKEIPIPPILRKPPSDPREKPKTTQRVLAIEIHYVESGIIKQLTLFTTLRLKDQIKSALRSTGYYLSL